MLKKDKYSIGLTITRVLLCFIIIKNMCFYLPLAEDYFGVDGIFPYASYLEQMNFYGLNLFIYPFHIPYSPHLFLILIIVLATCYMMAIGGRAVGILLYGAIIILKIRNGFILDGSDNVIQVVLPFVVLADNLEYFRYYTRKPNKLTIFLSNYSNIFAHAFMIQICFVYLFTGLAKHEGELWRNGTAVFYTMRVSDFQATDWNILLTENHYFVVCLTYFTMFWELAFPFLVWFKKTKFWIFLGGVILHVGIWFFMRIDNFSWVMLSSYFVFISNNEYRTIYLKIKRNKLKIFIDSWCPLCTKFGKRIKKIDTFNLITIEDIRTTSYLNREEKERGVKAMIAIDNHNRMFVGFDAIYHIFFRVPLGWLILPILAFLKLTKLGSKLYSELAVKRRIVQIHCEDKCNI